MNNKINIVLMLLVVTALTLGFSGIADAYTYQYINTSGQLNSVVANTPEEAIATAYQLALHSGVVLVVNDANAITNNQIVKEEGTNTYQYINTSGQLNSAVANTPKEAIKVANTLSLSNNHDFQEKGVYMYRYMNTSGQLSTAAANTPQKALAMSDTLSLSNSQVFQEKGVYMYRYMNTSGQLSTATGNIPEQVIATAFRLGMKNEMLSR